MRIWCENNACIRHLANSDPVRYLHLMGAFRPGSYPAAAYGYGEAPWCALYDIGEGSTQERCEFRDFESCRQEITGGNRGFCNHNPRWTGRTEQFKRRSP